MTSQATANMKVSPRLRPMPGAIPMGVRWAYVEWPRAFADSYPGALPISRRLYGVAILDRELTDAELDHFDLDVIA